MGTDVSHAQATIAIFLAGLAASQLLWGELLSSIGPRACVAVGSALLMLGAVGCALTDSFTWLLGWRLLQGIGAGAAAIVAPSVIRASLAGQDAVRGLAAIAMVEALVPAGGPVLGTLLLLVTDWRGTMVLMAATTAIALPFALRATPRTLPGLDRSVPSGYATILVNRRYLCVGLSHALAFGALLGFVASAPQWLHRGMGLGPSAFAALQTAGVAAFIVVASQAGRISARIGPAAAIRVGAVLQMLLCAALALVAWRGALGFTAMLVFWCLFCGALAVRGPAAFSEALCLPAAQLGRATAMLMLAVLAAGAVATQVMARWMEPLPDALALSSLLFAWCAASLALVVRYPQRSHIGPDGAGRSEAAG